MVSLGINLVATFVAVVGLAVAVIKVLRADIQRIDDKIEKLRENELTHLYKKLNDCCVAIEGLRTRLDGVEQRRRPRR